MVAIHTPDHPRRNFNSEATARFGRPTFDPDKLVKYSVRWQHARLMNFPYRRSHWRPRMRSIVVAVDGGSRGNNSFQSDSRAAYGVWFGRDCQWNTCGTLHPLDDQTNSRAELEAVRQALKTVQHRRQRGELPGWRELVIKTDSVYVAKSLSEYVWRWQENGWRKTNGKPVKHADLIRRIHNTICSMEQEMAVRFWRVGREWNTEADALVNRALDSAVDSGYEDDY